MSLDQAPVDEAGAVLPLPGAAGAGGTAEAAPPRGGVIAAVVVAVVAIGAGTWFLGSGPDEQAPAPDAGSVSAPVVPAAVPVQQQAPALAVAPAPSDEAYAQARKDDRASRAHKRGAVAPKAKNSR